MSERKTSGISPIFQLNELCMALIKCLRRTLNHDCETTDSVWRKHPTAIIITVTLLLPFSNGNRNHCSMKEEKKQIGINHTHTHTHIIRINGAAIYFSHFSKISRIRSIRNDDFVVWLNLLLRVKWNSIECVKCSSNKQYQFQKTSFLRGI